MELFAKIVNCFHPFAIFPKSSNLDVWQGSVYASRNNKWWSCFSQTGFKEENLFFHNILEITEKACDVNLRNKVSNIVQSIPWSNAICLYIFFQERHCYNCSCIKIKINLNFYFHTSWCLTKNWNNTKNCENKNLSYFLLFVRNRDGEG